MLVLYLHFEAASYGIRLAGYQGKLAQCLAVLRRLGTETAHSTSLQSRMGDPGFVVVRGFTVCMECWTLACVGVDR